MTQAIPAGLLARITQPRDLDHLSSAQLNDLADELRSFLIEKVTARGGHLGPNLGMVEVSIALHRAFHSPRDAILFDTGHQSYAHKVLTGRGADFDQLRAAGGLSGYPSRAESEHDWTESSHASAALSYADGLAKAFALSGQGDRIVVPVVGDGALTGGMCWEAMNNIAAGNLPVVVVVNDNGRSYAPTFGGLAEHLTRLRTRPRWDGSLEAIKHSVSRLPMIGRSGFGVLHAVKSALKDFFAPQMLFSDLGIKYVGPIDGHDIDALEAAFRAARGFGGPILVHVVTVKGKGFGPAEQDPMDRMHACGPVDAVTGAPKRTSSGQTWTDVFAEELIRNAETRDDVVAITAAMAGPTGLASFAARFPDRTFDVGIAEQHAVTSAAGLALGGLHPVVAVYSTFLNRAFDQLLMDVALLRLPVTLVLDRAGITGSDGPSHNGMWDLSLLSVIPGMRVAAPRDAHALRELLGEALAISDGPTALRFPKAGVGADIDAAERVDGVDVLRQADAPRVLLVAVGPLAGVALEAAELLAERGVPTTVVDPRWVLPVPEQVVKLADTAALVVTIEDSGVNGGVGSAVAARLSEAQVDAVTRSIAIPQQFIEQGGRDAIHASLGFTGAEVADRVARWDSAMARGESA